VEGPTDGRSASEIFFAIEGAILLDLYHSASNIIFVVGLVNSNAIYILPQWVLIGNDCAFLYIVFVNLVFITILLAYEQAYPS
jgi:hypothetical protein